MSSNKKKPRAESQLMEGGGRQSSTGDSKEAIHKCLIKESTGIFLNGLVFHSPVAIGALGLFPVVGTDYAMQSTAMLSLVMLVMMPPVCVLGGWMRIPVWIRPAATLVLSGVMYLPATALARWLIPQAFPVLSIYTVLMIGNSIILSRANDYTPPHITLVVLMGSSGCTAGFSVVIFLVTALREIWGNIIKDAGGVYHVGVYPLVGFLLLGVIATLIQHMNVKQAVAEKKAKQEWK